MKITKFVICDDIRLERDGKISLMGLYDDAIIFCVDSSSKGQWPKPLSFSLLLKLQIEDKDVQSGMVSIGINIEINGMEQEITKIDIKKEHLEERKNIGLMPKINNYPINSEGDFVVKVYLFDKKGVKVDCLTSQPTKIIESLTDKL